MPQFENYPAELRRKITAGIVDKQTLKNESLTWDDLRALRAMWPRKLIVKGILRADDARLAVEAGADAVMVSNHGGRNFDSSMAPIEVLPEIVDAVGHQTTVMVDGGFRRGSDVVKALALGADAVTLGRGTLYGVAAAGQPGAERALRMFREEIDRTLAFMGCNGIAELSRDHIRVRPTSYLAPYFDRLLAQAASTSFAEQTECSA
jgi:isopentenyl diphosphate isomerase/L-lactate dehydrogenase-like FMN-dependent dehydrogenase